MRFSTAIAGAVLALPFFAVANPHGHHKGRHDAIARRASGDVAHLNKRDQFNNVRFTFYDVGLGACGQTNQPGDFIVALTTLQFGGGYPGPNCFKSITINYNGKSAQATIMDECMGCPYGGLDFSRGLFDYFAPESEGVLTGSWSFNDAAPSPSPTPPPPPPPPPPPKTTPPPPPPPKSTTPPPPPPPKSTSPPPPPPPPSTTKTPSTTHTPTSTSHSTTPSSTHTSSSTSSTHSSTPSPTPTPVPAGPAFLAQVNQAALGLAALVVDAAAAAPAASSS